VSHKKTISGAWPELAGVPGLDEAYVRRYPHAPVALAVAALRGRLGLTQAEFADRIGTSQSAVARLESGRHGIQVSLLNRIADAFGLSWAPLFAPADADQAAIVETPAVGISDDPLVDAFNDASSCGDLETAHRHAARIARDPSSPRRKLVLAMDSYHRGRFKAALRWTRAARRAKLSGEARELATLVAGRSELALGNATGALKLLAGAGKGWMAHMARAEAHAAQDRTKEAIAAISQAIEAVPPERRADVYIVAASVFLKAGRGPDALRWIGAYRALEPEELAGRVLHGAILGFLGDVLDDETFYGEAMELFSATLDGNRPASLRFYAMTAARMGRWSDALRAAAKLAAEGSSREARRMAEAIADDCLQRLHEPTKLEPAIRLAARLELIDAKSACSHRAYARALAGDFDGAVSALGLSEATLAKATPADQLRCAIAFLVSGELSAAYPILTRIEAELTTPEAQLFLARTALAEQDTSTAQAALRRMADATAPGADVAQVALDLVSAIQSERMFGFLDRVEWRPQPASAADVFAEAEGQWLIVGSPSIELSSGLRPRALASHSGSHGQPQIH
jgi:transcriptional regulator with XRE-family HTH domain